jgi:hypothetical protein
MCCPQETLTLSIDPLIAPVKTRLALPEGVEAGAEVPGDGDGVAVGRGTGVDAQGLGEGLSAGERRTSAPTGPDGEG